MYNKYIKRLIDFIISLIALVVVSPLLLLLIIAGAFAMGGNPFYIQERPGKDEKIFKLIKLKTMNDEENERGELLDDSERLTSYGRFLRSTSLDEITELINIIKGDMSLVGPRPLLVKYLPLYDEKQRRRHDVLPGLTGLAQVNGRNSITWEEKFEYDLEYCENITFINDFKIIIKTVSHVFARDGISAEGCDTMEEFLGTVK